MRAFTAQRDGNFRADISRDEALLLQNLAAQVSSLLRDGSGDDPALMRLLPDAYPEDAEASAEFRRYTSSGLLDRKIANADTVLLSLTAAIDTGNLTLDAQEVQAWLRCLTDIRLTLASRLGIETDDQEPTGDLMLQELYDWLGFVQNSLVNALDHDFGDPAPDATGSGARSPEGDDVSGTVTPGNGMGDD